jgi:hypothetical protein
VGWRTVLLFLRKGNSVEGDGMAVVWYLVRSTGSARTVRFEGYKVEKVEIVSRKMVCFGSYNSETASIICS